MWKETDLMTTNQPLSLFISSKMDEMREERYAVQMALAAYRMYGWLWEQDAGARPEPIQSTYLKEVEACDIYVGLFWKGYGEYTIEEYRHARKHHKPCLIYEKQADIEQRDPQLTDFLKEINRVTDGLTVCRFENAEQLATQVQKDVIRFLTSRFRDTRQQPIWNIPFPRKEFFIGRKTLLKQLHIRLQTTRMATLGQRQVINGLGGIGKTQLAVEYAYQYRQEYQAVLWVHADTTEALNTSYTEIARLLQLPQKDAQEQEILVQGVKDWLSNQQNWLLILDNADEPDVLIPFLPPKVGGHLIVTTRAGDISHLGLGFGHALTVEKFTKNQSVSFLLQRAGLKRVSSQDREYARYIAGELDGLPLALNQAGVYLARTRSSLDSYWKMYQQQRALLLDIHEDREYPRSVAATLLLSFKRVEQRNPAAADVLRLCAFLAPDAIPEELLMKGARELGDVLAPIAEDNYQLDQAFADLRAYSLLTRDPQSQTLMVHRLVQAVLRDSMSIEMQQQWMLRVVQVVNVAFSGIEFEDWPTCERLLPHALICATWIEQIPFVPVTARLLNQVGYYLINRGRYKVAEQLLKHSLAICEQELGFMHLDTARSLNNLAILYQRQGKYKQAEPMSQRVLAIREQLLGGVHLDTATSLSNLAEVYRQLGKYKHAEPMSQRALAIREQLLGGEHPFIARSLNNLAILYQRQGKYEHAEKLFLRALAIHEQQLGVEHPDTAINLSNLAVLYQQQGKYEHAEKLFLQALAISKQQLGNEHPDTAMCMSELAMLYQQERKYEHAETLFLQALAIYEQQLGAEHPETADSLHGLAQLYHQMERYEQAEALYLRALAIREQHLGATHPDTANTLYGLAQLYHQMEKYEQSEALYQRTLTIHEQQLGFEHPATQAVRENHTSLLGKMKREQEKGETDVK
jgi:tetratricopeptide (TPR) repeat protein